MAAPVTICDVGPRDGLQNEAETLAPEVRAELVNRLAAAGLRSIEAVSFVRAESVPQMAGAEEVVAGIERQDGVTYSGLVLNEKGYERLAACGLDAVHFTLGATDEFNRRNANRTVDESVAELERIDTDLPVSVSISVSFGCPFEGDVSPDTVIALAERCVAAGAGEIVFADTIGVGVPHQARDLVNGEGRLASPWASISTTRVIPASPTRMRPWKPARRSSSRRWAGSAVARSRRAPRATSPRRISSSSSMARAWKRG